MRRIRAPRGQGATSALETGEFAGLGSSCPRREATVVAAGLRVGRSDDVRRSWTSGRSAWAEHAEARGPSL